MLNLYNSKAKSFVTIMLVIAALSLLLRFVLEKFIKLSMAQNESGAELTLKLVSTALENYAKDNKGVYPANLSVLLQGNPAYLDKDYTALTSFKGYVYNCSRLDDAGYSCTARPKNCNITGTNIYTVQTGGLVISDKCLKEGEE